MTTGSGLDRRRFLYRIGAVATAGVLAGCAGGDGSSGGSGSDSTATGTDTRTTTATSTGRATTTATPPATETNTGTTGTGGGTTTETTDASPVVEPAPESVDQYLADARFYNGDMVVGVPFVGVGASKDGIGFDPAAIKVSVGTEVTWQWVDRTELHSVLSTGNTGTAEGIIDSGRPRKGTGITYRHTFEQPGIYRYFCGVHRARGAHGVVVVERGRVGGSGSGLIERWTTRYLTHY